ncbi:MAG: nucleoside hydrolase [bacterium]|nr:nucleoside hydrolase [bacterium]
MKIWIDTDLGSDVDDALTLAYVLRHPGFELVGVSTVFGDVDLRTRITRKLLERASVTDVPVLTGLGAPLSADRKGVMFGHEGIGLLEEPQPRMRTTEDPDADVRIRDLSRQLEAAQPDVLLAIGPLTNLGALVDAGVPLPRLAIMGGKTQDIMLEGMTPIISEWNWYCDPLAVQKVMAVAHPELPRVVPAEVTFRTSLADGDVEKLARGDALAQDLSRLCKEWLRALAERFGAKRPRVALHDPLTAATLVENGLCSFKERRIRVDDAGATTLEDGTPNAEIAVDVDNPTLRTHLMATWL